MVFSLAGKLVKQILERYNINEKNFAVFDIWQKEAGKLTKQAEMVGFKDGYILLEVPSAIYKQEITLRKNKLVEKINDNFGDKKVVKGIKFTSRALRPTT